MARPENLQEMLAAEDIRPKTWRTGSTTQMICPKCGGGSTKAMSLSLSIDADGQGAVAKCHRASCGWTFGNRVSGVWERPKRQPDAQRYQQPVQHALTVRKSIAAVYSFFEGRGICQETVDLFGCYVVSHRFPGDMGVHDAIVFPYQFDGQTVNRKYRAIADKNFMAQEAKALPSLFNIDSVVSPDVTIWVEGEPDVMALHECGYPQAVTLKDGAPDRLRDEDDPARLDDKRFAALATHADLLEDVQKFILAGDMDLPGSVLREELARRLGKHRCWTVDWPVPCKDACDVLREHGPERVRQCIEAARPYPIEGVHEVSGEMLDLYLELPAPKTMTTGVREVDNVLKIPGEGRVIIVTGFPNAGKTPWVMNVMIHLMKYHGRKFLVFSPEMQPLEEFLVQLAEVLVGKPARKMKDFPGIAVMTREERKKAGNWLQERMAFLSSDAENHIPSLDWVLDRARACVLRLGTTDLVIDPFNELEQSHGKDMSETQFVGYSLQRANAFSLRHGCNTWIIAHPAKPPPPQQGKPPAVPNGYSISGSAHWFNKCALGITVHRPGDLTQIHIWKAKFKRLGNKGAMATIEYDLPTGRYVSPADPDASDRYRRESGGE